MVEALLHENFYVTGAWMDESLGVYVGWIERKGSFCEEMPLENERKDVVLVFSGEEFPEPGTRQRLKERGHHLNEGQASYLVHLYEEENQSFPAILNGRFQGLLIDRGRGTAVLFNDRYGMHRVYYHESKDAFYFAAEAKAILAVRPELRTLAPRSLGEFVSCGSVLENRTLFEGIHILPPASAWSFRNGSVDRKRSYFHPREWEDQERLDPEAYYRELREIFTRNLPRYFDGRERIGMSLTGGLDTRMIMAWQRLPAGSLPCYTFGSMFRENQDVRVSRRVASICNQPHQVITAGQEFLSEFRRYAERVVYLTDGCLDVGRAPDLYLNAIAREIAPVRMTGNYGGEILRGVRTFKPEEPMAGLFSEEFLGHIRQAKETYSVALQGNPVSLAAFKQAPWHQRAILSLEQTQLSVRSPFLDNDFVRTVFRAPESALVGNEVCMRLIADGDKALLRVPTDRGLVGEQRPFSQALSHGFLEFLFKAEYAYDSGMPQWVAQTDYFLSPLRLERLFLGRHKPFQFRVWYRDQLAEYVKEVLLDPRSLSRPYIERKQLEAVVRGHVKGNRNYTSEIHKLLTLELLHRLFIDRRAQSSPAGVGGGDQRFRVGAIA
ncbi:MAG: asparagine synthase-related protein [Candidatus Acidiferrales bacterium]